MRKLEEVIEKSDPKGWADNYIGELAAFCHTLALEVKRLREIIDEKVPCHDCGDVMHVVTHYECEICGSRAETGRKS